VETGEAAKGAYISPNFREEYSSPVALAFFADRDSLRYLVTDPVSCLCLAAGFLPSPDRILSPANVFGSIIPEKVELSSVVLYVASLPFGIMPGAVYSADLAESALEISYGSPVYPLAAFPIRGEEIMLFAESRADWKSKVESVFPQVRTESFPARAIEFLLAGQKVGKMLIHSSASYTEIYVVRNGELLLANLYDTQSAEDVLYFAALAAGECGFSREKEICVYTGEEGTSLQLLKTYFVKIIFPDEPEGFSSGATDFTAALRPFLLSSPCA
jgi:hypothetical protein